MLSLFVLLRIIIPAFLLAGQAAIVVLAMPSPMCYKTYAGKRLCGQDHGLLPDAWNNRECLCGNRHGILISCEPRELLQAPDSPFAITTKTVCVEEASADAPFCTERWSRNASNILCGASHTIPAGFRECQCPTDDGGEGMDCIPDLSSDKWVCRPRPVCTYKGFGGPETSSSVFCGPSHPQNWANQPCQCPTTQSGIKLSCMAADSSSDDGNNSGKVPPKHTCQ